MSVQQLQEIFLQPILSQDKNQSLSSTEEISQLSTSNSRGWYSFHDLNMLGAVSSTQARASTDVNCLEKIVTPSVATYIRNNHLYAFSSTM